MNSQLKKQYLKVQHLPVLTHTILRFIEFRNYDGIVVVVPGEDLDYCKENILKPVGQDKKLFMVSGGNHRQASVANGINFIKNLDYNYEKSIVLIHDGVRPCIDKAFIERCIKGAVEFGACVPGVKTVDTVKEVHNGIVTKTLDRENIFNIQTPQAFVLKIIIDAIEFARKNKFKGTDDASLVEFYGHDVAVINGLKRNIKITTKEDISIATPCLGSD